MHNFPAAMSNLSSCLRTRLSLFEARRGKRFLCIQFRYVALVLRVYAGRVKNWPWSVRHHTDTYTHSPRLSSLTMATRPPSIPARTRRDCRRFAPFWAGLSLTGRYKNMHLQRFNLPLTFFPILSNYLLRQGRMGSVSYARVERHELCRCFRAQVSL